MRSHQFRIRIIQYSACISENLDKKQTAAKGEKHREIGHGSVDSVFSAANSKILPVFRLAAFDVERSISGCLPRLKYLPENQTDFSHR